jgi:serine/threonine-protein kinase
MAENVTDRLRTALADRYRLERELGAGGMATVYLAHDVKHERPVAIKVLHPELGAVLGAERFLSEIRTTANLQHPNILPLFDSGAVDGLVYYVMPYVEGETLRDRIKREGQLAVGDAVKLTQGVAAALDYAHRHGVIHRDIKPENILLQDGQALVADFGVALAVSNAGGARITQTGISVGTPQYMSPEQAAAERQLDGRSDQYSLAAVLYEMLAGEAPFTGPSAPAILTKLMTEQVPPLTARRPSVPLGLADAVHRALEKVPADRFATAAEFAEALTRERTGTYRTTASGRAQRARNRAVIGTAAVLLIAASSYMTWLGASRVKPSEAVMRVVLDVPEAPRQHSQWGRTVDLSRGRPGAFYFGIGGRWFRPFDSLGSRFVPGTSGEGFRPAPDGQHALVRSGAWVGRLQWVPLDGGGARLISDSVMGPVQSMGTDGYVYFTTPELALARASLNGGPLERLTTLDQRGGETYHFHPEPLPSGRGVLFTVGYRGIIGLDSAFVAVLDRRTGERRNLFPGFSPRYLAPGYLLFATVDGALRAVAFDERSLTVSGAPVALVKSVRISLAQAGADYDISEAGDLIYVTAAAEARQHLVWTRRDGTVTQVDSTWPGRIRGFDLSPDGRRLAVSLYQDRKANDVWVRNLPDGAPSRLTNVNVLAATPRWTPDGRSLIFSSPRPPERLAWDLYLQPANGGPDSLLVDGARQTGAGMFSPDGQRLVWAEAGDIFTRGPGSGQRLMPLAASRFDEASPALSRDGRWLAYESDESGLREVYVRRLEPATSAYWQVSVAGGTEPRWSHSGRELFFDDSTRTLVAATLQLGAEARVESRVPLFSRRAYLNEYVVLPGDRGFIHVRRPYDRGWGDMVLIRGIGSEVKRLVRGGQ